MKKRPASLPSARRTFRRAALLGLAASASLFPRARAATYTWDGASGPNPGNYFWSNPGNWTTNAAPPTSGLTTTDLIFGNAPSEFTILDTAYSVHSLTITSDAKLLAFLGGTLTLGAGGLTQNSTNEVRLATTPVILGAAQTWTLASGAGPLNLYGGLDTAGYALTVSAATTTGNGGNLLGGTITGTGSLTKTGAGTLTLTDNNTYSGATTISTGVLQVGNGGTGGSLSTGAVNDNATLAFNLSSDATVANAISGTGSLTKAGAGTVTVTGTASYTGNTTVSAGTLDLGGGTVGSSGSKTVAASSVSVDGTDTATLSLETDSLKAGTISVGISGSGAILQNRGDVTVSTLTLGQNQGSQGSYAFNGYTFTGNSIEESTLTVYSLIVGSSGRGSFSQEGGSVSVGTLTLGVGNAGFGAYTFDGGYLKLGTTGDALNIYHGTFTQNAGTLVTNGQQITVAGNFNLNGGSVVTKLGLPPPPPAGVTQIGVTGSTSSGNFTQNGGDFDTHTLLFISSGEANTYTLNGGSLTVGSITVDDQTGSTGSGVGSGSTFNFNGGTVMVDTPNTVLIGGLAQALVQAGGAKIDGFGTGVTTIAQALLHDPALGSTVDGGLALAGTFKLTAANTLTGPTSITEGTLNLANALALQNSTLNINVGDINGKVVFDSSVTGHAFTLGGLGGSIGLKLADNGSTPAAVALTVGNNNQDATYTGNLSGAGNLIKVGTGTQVLAGTNTYAGPTTISAGTLQFASPAALYNTTSATAINATVGNLRVASGATAAFNVGGTGEFTSAQIGALAALGNASGGFQVGSTLGLDTTNASGPATISANLFNPNVLTLAKLGTGTLALTGNNAYTGGTLLNAGTLNVGSTGALGNTGTISFNGGTLQYSAANHTDYSGRFSQASGQDYRIDTNGQNITFAAALNSQTGPLLTKLGDGTLTLTGASRYTGATTVSAGVLLANSAGGSATGTGTVNVLGGATLGGNGTISGVVVVQSGGMLDPGASSMGASRLTLGNNLTFNAGSTLGIELGGTAAGSGYSQVRVAGALDLGSSNLLVTTINNFSLAVGQVFVIAEGTGSGSLKGMFADTSSKGSLYTDGTGDTFLVRYGANTDGGTVGNDVTITVQSVVPEPSTWALVGVGIAGLSLAGLRRKRRVTGV